MKDTRQIRFRTVPATIGYAEGGEPPAATHDIGGGQQLAG
jgi:hypothetical protein